jgi:hypothetical protein
MAKSVCPCLEKAHVIKMNDKAISDFGLGIWDFLGGNLTPHPYKKSALTHD